MQVPEEHRDRLQQLLDQESPGDQIIWDPSADPNIPSEIRDMFIGVQKLAANTVERLTRGYSVTEKIYVALVGSMEFQAAAVELSENEFCILIWMGSYFRSRSAPKHVVGSPRFHDLFGTDLSEYKFVGTGESPTKIFVEQMSLSPEVPMTDANHRFSALMCSGVLEWLVLHELGHIFNGHLRLGREIAGLRFMIEKSDEENIEDEMITSQALEFDADCFATQNLLIFSHQFGGHIATGLKERGKIDAGSHAAFALLCTDVAGKFLEYDLPDRNNLFEYDHPWGELRTWSNTLQTVAVLESKPWSLTSQDAQKAIMVYSFSLDRAIYEVSNVKSDTILQAIDAAGGWIPRVLARWAKLRPQLLPHVLGDKKLAPASEPPA